MEGVERRLAAILSADAVGFSRLMADDDVATLRAITESRDLLAELVERHGGRVSCQSREGGGSRFVIFLPAAASTSANGSR